MILKNYTPHNVVVFSSSGDIIATFPSEGVARLEEYDVDAGNLTVEIPLTRKTYSDVIGIPSPVEGTVYIVSKMVLDESDRTDLVAPDTGSGAVRNEKG
jgi:hypothetical protein